MIKQAIQKKIYTNFEVGKLKVELNLLHCADDTLFFGEATLANVITIKSMLRCFELISSLNMNFHKSFLFLELWVWYKFFWRAMQVL